MDVRTKIVLLMHDKEWRRQKTNTGRLATLHVAGSEILHGLGFDDHPRLRQLMDDPGNFCALLYPGPGALNLSDEGVPPELLDGRRLVAFIVDATWSCSRAVLRASPGLLGLPRLAFNPGQPSRWLIKKQPRPEYLSTIETVHELLLALERTGVDSYPDKDRLLAAFMAMQDYQIHRATSAPRPRHHGMGPTERPEPSGPGA